MRAKLELKKIASVEEIGEEVECTQEFSRTTQRKYSLYEITKYQITLKDGQQITLPAEIVMSISTEG
jgi:hypothetical protein